MTFRHRAAAHTTMTPGEALELELERAWCDLKIWPAVLYLTPAGEIVSAKRGESILGAEEIGRYTKAVKLADFRGDVFHVFEAMTRRGHRAPV